MKDFDFSLIYLPIIYIIIAYVIYRILSRIAHQILHLDRSEQNKNPLQRKRERTIINLIKSILKYIIAVITFLAILNIYGIKTTSIIASLGIAGAILGLAFQDTLKNLLSGIAIIFDNHYMQGDVVTINGFRGEVIELGLQTTKIKAYNGEVMIINNSLITSVINHSMYNTNLYLELPVEKNISLDKIENMLTSVNKKLKKNKDVKNDIELLGIEKLDSNKYIYKIMIECSAESEFSINREFMKYLKEEYEMNKIDVPSNYFEVKTKK